ncbi:MAG: 3-dehydroquinate synthase family protein [Planctomycetota bacterium]
MRTVRVTHAGGAYDVRIGAGVLETLPDRVAELAPRSNRVVTVHDRGAPAEPLLAASARLNATHQLSAIPFDPSERDKSLAKYGEIQRRLAAESVERTDVLVAYGGGVTGDLGGFAAATYRRGMALIQCPTTLLSMVDASVGGKTGVNLALGDADDAPLLKNMVGAFYQPLEVLADVSVLSSLDERTFRSGLGECVKHGLIAGAWDDAGLLDWTRANADAILARDTDTLEELVTRNVAVKARVVAADERELATGRSGRQLLNLGHTFAHAFEPVPGLGPDGGLLTHGEAVALGTLAASRCAAALGRVEPDHQKTLKELLTRFGLPTTLPPSADAPALVARMHDDKKAVGGQLRVVLPTGDATAEVTNAPSDDRLAATIRMLVESR